MTPNESAPAITGTNRGEALTSCPKSNAGTLTRQGGRIERIRELHTELEDLGRTALEKAIEAGTLLREAKAELGHGQWLPWLKENFSFTDRTARRWMKVSENHEAGKLDTVSDLGEAYRLGTTANSTEAPRLSAKPGALLAMIREEDPFDLFLYLLRDQGRRINGFDWLEDQQKAEAYEFLLEFSGRMTALENRELQRFAEHQERVADSAPPPTAPEEAINQGHIRITWGCAGMIALIGITKAERRAA